MTKPKPVQEVFCPECGAQNVGAPVRCWLCYHLLPVDAIVVEAPPVLPKPVDRRHDATTSTTLLVLTIFTAVLVVLVGIGAFATDPSLGLIYCLVVAPSLIVAAVTYAVARLRSDASVPVTQPWRASLTSFFISLGATLAVAVVAVAVSILIAVAAIIALIVQCFAALGGVR